MATVFITKHSDAKLAVGMDFSNDLSSGETLSSPIVTDDTGDLTITGTAVDGNNVEFFVAGGTDGTNYYIKVQATSSSGEILVQEGILRIRDRG
jgi:hypothetical protein